MIHHHDHHWQPFQVLKIIIVNILLSLGDQISDFLQVFLKFFFLSFGKQSALALLVEFNDQAFNLLFLTWWSDGQVPEWEEYWHEKYESPDYLIYFSRPYLYIVSLHRGKYGLLILLVNWSPGIIALMHMVAYHR